VSFKSLSFLFRYLYQDNFAFQNWPVDVHYWDQLFLVKTLLKRVLVQKNQLESGVKHHKPQTPEESILIKSTYKLIHLTQRVIVSHHHSATNLHLLQCVYIDISHTTRIQVYLLHVFPKSNGPMLILFGKSADLLVIHKVICLIRTN
jgi:hypothetical protein